MSEKAVYPTPQYIFEQLWHKVPRYIKLTFFTSFALCLLIHHQAYSLSLLNLDNLGHLFGSQYGAASGRWLLPILLRLDGNISVSWTLGVIAACFLALSACLIVFMTRIRSSAGCVAASALLVSFPAITSNHFYMFSADAYMFSLFLACFGAYLVFRFRWGVLPGAVAIALSASIYQAYVSIAAGLLVGVMIYAALEGEEGVWSIIRKGLRYLFTLAAGIGLYYLLVKLTSRTTGLVDYMGISEMGSLAPKDILKGTLQAFYYYLKFFIEDYLLVHTRFSKIAFLCMLLASVILVVLALQRKKTDRKHIAFLVFLVPVFLLAANLIKVMTPSSGQHALMIYGFVLIPLAAIGLLDYLSERPVTAGKCGTLFSCCAWIILCGAVTLSATYSLKANEAYFRSILTEKQGISYGTRLLSTAQQTEGYEPGMPIALIGTDKAVVPATPQLNTTNITGCMDLPGLVHTYTFDLFLHRYCGWSDEIYIKPEELAPYIGTQQAQDLAVYPSPGSACIIDGTVVIRMS